MVEVGSCPFKAAGIDCLQLAGHSQDALVAAVDIVVPVAAVDIVVPVADADTVVPVAAVDIVPLAAVDIVVPLAAASFAAGSHN